MTPSDNILSGTILVTGGAGFIGSAVIRCLLDESDVNIVNVDKLTYAANLLSLPQDHPRHRLETTDICHDLHLREIFNRYQPSAVVHLAAESHVDRSIDGPGAFINTNLVGTYTVLQEALRHWQHLAAKQSRDFRFIHISTDEVFGSLSEHGLFTESSPYSPNSPYAATKAGSDHLARAWHHTYGLPVVITNCSNNYGPRQFPEKLIPLMILRGMKRQSLPIYGDGMNVRDWLYVEDHARALVLILKQGTIGESYNIGARNERTNKEIVETVCDLLDKLMPSPIGKHRALIEFVTDRPGHDRRYAIDASKIEREFGWRPTESFESALTATVQWYIQNKPWWEAILRRGYAPNRIGSKQDLAATDTRES